MNSGKEVVLVTSGAVGVGVNKLKLKERPKTIKEKQAAAAVGQSELMHIYGKFFGEYSHIVGQVLLTRDVVEDEHIRENVVNTFETLIENKVIPIVNENDTVAIDEIENIVRFGDNDNLSAIVAGLVSADLLIILSDIDGFYDLELIRQIAENVSIPVIASGGAGTKEHFYEALTEGKADAALAASLFHYKELEIMDLKNYLAQRGVSVRK